MSSYREQLRADKVADAEQKRQDAALRAEQAREDRRLELEARAQRDADRAEQKRLDDAAAAEQARKDAEAKRRQEQADRRAKQQEAERKKAIRRAKVAKVTRWLNGNPVTVFVGFVMVASVVPAVISQVAALGDAQVHVLLAALLAAMLEGGAWALTFMGKAAEEAGRPAAKYRIATWCTAFVAAGVNFWHWAEKLPDALWVAVVFAGSSLFAIYLWDMKTHGSEGKTREERQKEKARRKHEKARRKHHKDVAQEADRLLSAAPFGSLTDGEAFAAAWRIRYGTEPGLTPEHFSMATAARVELGAAFAVAEENRPELIRAGLLASLANPLPTLPGRMSPALGSAGPVAPLQGAAEGRTTQFPQGKQPVPGSSGSGAHKAPAQGAGNGGKDGRDEHDGTSWERHLDRARAVALDLLAEGKTISATSLAKRLKVRREDAMKLRDVIVAERKGDHVPLRVVPNAGEEPAAMAAGA